MNTFLWRTYDKMKGQSDLINIAIVAAVLELLLAFVSSRK